MNSKGQVQAWVQVYSFPDRDGDKIKKKIILVGYGNGDGD